jgi:adenylate cyclase
VDAVQCAVAVQKELQARNSDLPEDRRMQFRIGINLGDVIEEKERIYGDGVNIAARLEALAEPGGICVSKTAFDQIESKLPLGYQFLGEQTVKNIAKPVGAYKVLLEPRVIDVDEKEEAKEIPFWQRKVVMTVGILVLLIIVGLGVWNFFFRAPLMETASEERMAFPLPDKPSIAVLPFTNMSGDPEQEYIGDGLSENIISALSKISKMFVIARNSSFSYKGKSVKVQQVAEELGVRYVLEGSVQKSADRVRITAQLIDALSGHHLWSEKYDREMRELFDLQDEITKKILVELQVELTYGEMARVYAKDTENMEAWSHLVKGIRHSWKMNKEDVLKGREYIKRAIKLDPGYVTAWAWLGNSYTLESRTPWCESPTLAVKRSYEATQKALELNENHPFGHGGMATIYIFRREHEKAIAEGKKAITLDPNYASGYFILGNALRFAGRFEEAIDMYKKAMRLNPGYPPAYLHHLAQSYTDAGRYEEAISAFNQLDARCHQGECPSAMPLIGLARVYVELDKNEEARVYMAKALKANPKLSLESALRKAFYKNPADQQRFAKALIQAGLPETPPLPLPDKPSIAVLPFVNMSGDPEQEYFSDGITEDIITALSKTPKLFVIARTSSFKYKGKEVDVRKVGRELGVRYVLEGSVRRSEDRLRITAQLVDAKTGNHLWAERYDRELKDIFAVQDEITLQINTALQVKLTKGEQARMRARGTDNLEAYLKASKGLEYFFRFTKEDNLKARQIADEVIALDPNYAYAYSLLGHTYNMGAMRGWDKSPRESLEKAFELGQKAIALDDGQETAYRLLGSVYLIRRQPDKAIAEFERAVAVAPNSSFAHAGMGHLLIVMGRSEEAITAFEKALRLNPFPPGWFFQFLGIAYFFTGNYEEAIKACQNALHITPTLWGAPIYLAAAYSLSGRKEEAHNISTEILKKNPKFTVEAFIKRSLISNQNYKDLLVEGLRKAGLE